MWHGPDEHPQVPSSLKIAALVESIKQEQPTHHFRHRGPQLTVGEHQEAREQEYLTMGLSLRGCQVRMPFPYSFNNPSFPHK